MAITGGMPELLCSHGGYAGTVGGSGGDMAEPLWAHGGGMPELLGALEGYAGTFVGLAGIETDTWLTG